MGPPDPLPSDLASVQVPMAGAVRGVLAAALTGSLAFVLWAGTAGPAFLLVTTLAPVGVVGYVALIRHPLAHLCVVLAGFVFAVNYREGVQASELVFGAYYVGYLAGWFALRTRNGRPLVRDGIDAALVLFIGYVTLSLALVPLRAGDFVVALNQWRVLLIFLFYFPVRAAIEDDPRAVRWLLAAVLFVALFVVARNLFRYLSSLQSKDALWEILLNRAREAERIVAASLLGTLLLLVTTAKRWLSRGVLLVLAAVQIVSILLGQSRTMWLGLAVSLAIATAFLRGNQRTALFATLATSVAFIYGVSVFLFGDIVHEFATQYVDRASTIGATSSDISFINRVYEWRTAVGYFLQSPIFGYGLGVPYNYYSLIYEGTESKFFSHSTYITQLYRHGIVGASLLGTVGLGITFRAVQLAWSLRASVAPFPHAVAVTCLAALVLLAMGGLTESMFSTADGVYIATVVFGITAGLRYRSRPSARR